MNIQDLGSSCPANCLKHKELVVGVVLTLALAIIGALALSHVGLFARTLSSTYIGGSALGLIGVVALGILFYRHCCVDRRRPELPPPSSSSSSQPTISDKINSNLQVAMSAGVSNKSMGALLTPYTGELTPYRFISEVGYTVTINNVNTNIAIGLKGPKDGIASTAGIGNGEVGHLTPTTFALLGTRIEVAGIFDECEGQGAASYVVDQLQSKLIRALSSRGTEEEHLCAAAEEACRELAAELTNQNGGTYALFTLKIGHRLYFINVGTSRAILTFHTHPQLGFSQMTLDKKDRSLGIGHLSSEPICTAVNLNTASNKCVVMASASFWEALTNQDVYNLIRTLHADETPPAEMAAKLIATALATGSSRNIVVMVRKF